MIIRKEPSESARFPLNWRLVGLVLVTSLILMTVTLLIKNVNLPSPIMGPDEYAYFSQSREFPRTEALYTYDPTNARSHNITYFSLARPLWKFTVDPALSMKVLQTVLYALTILLFYSLCRRFLTMRKSAVCAFLLMISALSSYTAYFMPETLYIFFLFLMLAFSMSQFKRPFICALSIGLFAAVLTLTKPHGIAIFVAAGLTWSIVFAFPRLIDITRATAAHCLAILVGGYVTGLISLNAVLTGRIPSSPLRLLGDGYVGFWASRPKAFASMTDVLTTIVGNGIAIALLIGFPIIYFAFWIASCRGSMDETFLKERAKLIFLCIFATSIFGTSVAMTVHFTSQVGGDEIWRIHGRYYSYVVPLFFLLMFVAEGQRPDSMSDRHAWTYRLVALGGFALLIAVQFCWRTNYIIVPWDFPELFALSHWDWSHRARDLGSVILLSGAGFLVAMLVRPRASVTLFVCFFSVLSSASLVQTTRWQFAHGRGLSPYADIAVAIRTLIPQDKLDKGVIVGTDRGSLSYVVVNLRSKSRVDVPPIGTVVDQNRIGKADWALVDRSFRVAAEGAHKALSGEKFDFWLLRDIPPFLFHGPDKKTTGH